MYRNRGSTLYAPRGCHDGKVHLLCEDGGREDDVDGGAEPLVGEEDGGGVEEEGGEATEAAEGEEQVHGGLPSPGVPARVRITCLYHFNHLIMYRGELKKLVCFAKQDPGRARQSS